MSARNWGVSSDLDPPRLRPAHPLGPALLSSGHDVDDAVALRTGREAVSGDPRTVNGVTDGDDAPDAGGAFVGSDAADARLDAVMARPGMAERVAKIRAEMAAADSADLWTDLVGPFYDGVVAAAVLGVSVDAVRARARRGSVLALRTGSGSVVFRCGSSSPARSCPVCAPSCASSAEAMSAAGRLRGGSDPPKLSSAAAHHSRHSPPTRTSSC